MATSSSSPTIKFIHPDDMPDLYALTGRGTCMEPLYKDNCLLAFDKRLEPQPGDVLGIIFTPEAARRWGAPGALKRLVYDLPPAGFDGLIVAEQLNPPRKYAFDTTDVLAVHKCIGTAQRQANGAASVRQSQIEGVAAESR